LAVGQELGNLDLASSPFPVGTPPGHILAVAPKIAG